MFNGVIFHYKGKFVKSIDTILEIFATFNMQFSVKFTCR